MQKIQDVYNRIQEKKKERKKIKALFKEAQEGNTALREVKEQLDALKAKKKSLEAEINSEFSHEQNELEGLDKDIKDDQQMMDDIAITMYSQGEPIRFKDENDEEYEPVFSVKYRKAQ